MSRHLTRTARPNPLPTEILSEIFLFCHEEDNEEEGFPSQFHYECTPKSPFSLVLSSVCARWRAIATSLAGLWSRIYIVFQNGEEMTEDRLARLHLLTELFLERSKQVPLEITIQVPRYDRDYPSQTPYPHDLFASIFTSLLSHRHRWLKARLRIPTKDFVRLFGQEEAGFPQLESLELECSPHMSESDALTSLVHVADMPSLSELALGGFECDLPLQSDLDMSSVRVLAVSLHYCIPEVLDFLEHGPSDLLELNLFGIVAATEEEDEDRIVSSPLQMLYINALDYLSLHTFFNHVELRQLTSLRVKNRPSHNVHFPTEAFRQCLSLSGCPPITNLWLEDMRISDSDLITVLEHIPHLTHLCLMESPSSPTTLSRRFLTRMSIAAADDGSSSANLQPLVPKLEDIFLGYRRKPVYRHLLELLRSRTTPSSLVARGVTKLEDFTLGYSQDFELSPKGIEALRQYAASSDLGCYICQLK